MESFVGSQFTRFILQKRPCVMAIYCPKKVRGSREQEFDEEINEVSQFLMKLFLINI